jgi:hypothetical protein
VGGTAGQILSKIDATNYNTQWIAAPSGGGGGASTWVVLSADESIPGAAYPGWGTMVGLHLPLTAGKIHHFRWWLFYGGPSPSSYKLQGPAMTWVKWVEQYLESTFVTRVHSLTDYGAQVGTGSTPTYLMIEGSCLPSASGDLDLQFQLYPAATPIIGAGSTAQLEVLT